MEHRKNWNCKLRTQDELELKTWNTGRIGTETWNPQEELELKLGTQEELELKLGTQEELQLKLGTQEELEPNIWNTGRIGTANLEHRKNWN